MKELNSNELDALLHSMQSYELQLADAPVREYKRRRKMVLCSLFSLGFLLAALSVILYRRR